MIRLIMLDFVVIISKTGGNHDSIVKDLENVSKMNVTKTLLSAEQVAKQTTEKVKTVHSSEFYKE